MGLRAAWGSAVNDVSKYCSTDLKYLQRMIRIKALVLSVCALAALLVPVAAEPELSYPLFFASYREVTSAHADINALRKQRDGGFTNRQEAYDILTRMLASCPSDAYLIVEQPGIRVEDFQSFVTPYGPRLWQRFKEILGHAATIGSFPRLDGPISTQRLERLLTKQCSSETIVVDPRADDPMYEKYSDTRPRVLRLTFPPLPEDPVERAFALEKHDEKIWHSLKLTPSPFFFIIYTSGSEGEPFYPDSEEYKQQKRWDIFADLVRQKRDPRNRNEWKNHLRREKGVVDAEPPAPLPPLMEKRRRDKEALLRKKRGAPAPELFLSKESVAMAMAVSVGLYLVYAIFKGVFKLNAYLRSAEQAAQPGTVPAPKASGTASRPKHTKED